MEIKKLKTDILNKYGLRFTKEPSGMLVLRLRDGVVPFALVDTAKDRLAVKCPSFASVIKDLPQFEEPELTHQPDWVELQLSTAKEGDVSDILDYGFKSASNGNHKFVAQQLTFLPAEDVEEKYQAQKIPARPNGRPLPKRHQPDAPAPLAKMMAHYDYTVLPADERAYNFYHQGQMVADYEDDYDQLHELHHYYPDYHCMNVNQLRTYFSWRTQLRRGNFTVTSTSYAYVYIYELLNNIGVKDSSEGFQLLCKFAEKYAPSYDQRMRDYLDQWIKDYVLYYGMDRQDANQAFQTELNNDRGYHILIHPQDYQPKDIVEVLQKLCPYFKRCRLAKSAPDEWALLVEAVWRKLMDNHPEYFKQLVATKMATSHYFFAGAVFYYRQTPHNEKYVIDSERTYVGDGRKYECQQWMPIKEQGRRLNAFFHEVDRLTREHLHLGHPLKPRLSDQQLLGVIHAGIIDYQRAKEEASRPHIKLNMANLGQIRADASVTRESLLTDEEKDDDSQVTPTKQKPSEEVADTNNPTAQFSQSQPKDNDQSTSSNILSGGDTVDTDEIDVSDDDVDDEAPSLSKDERFLLVALLKHQPYQDYAKKHHLMVSILVDSINEKLMDLFGDTVIDYDDNGQPAIIDDYRDDCADLYLPKEDQ